MFSPTIRNKTYHLRERTALTKSSQGLREFYFTHEITFITQITLYKDTEMKIDLKSELSRLKDRAGYVSAGVMWAGQDSCLC